MFLASFKLFIISCTSVTGIAPSFNNLLVTSLSTELGKVEEYLNISKNASSEIDISFSSRYMLEALRTMEEENILLLLNSDVKPIIIKSSKDETLIQLILPIKTY